jgi:hypothetical protein
MSVECEPPAIGCSCGIYATYDIREAFEYGAFIGLVRPVGRTIPATDGWRAAEAVVEMLAAPRGIASELPPEVQEKLCSYDVLLEEAKVPLQKERMAAHSVVRHQKVRPELDLSMYARIRGREALLEVKWESVSVARRYRCGQVWLEEWYDNNSGLPHREGGPAVIAYNPGGEPQREEWHRMGCLSREDGPALIYRSGGMELRAWYRGGHLLLEEWKPIRRRECGGGKREAS